jgi:hypothetical protein
LILFCAIFVLLLSSKKLCKNTLTVFNSTHSTTGVKVEVERDSGEDVSFKVPPGNSISKTIEGAESVTIKRIHSGDANGKFCIDVSLIIQSDITEKMCD